MKLLIEVAPNYFQYACIIYGHTELTESTLSFSIYPHRALGAEHYDAVRKILPKHVRIKKI